MSGRLERRAAGRLPRVSQPLPGAWLSAAALVVAAALLAPSAAHSLGLFTDTGQAQNGSFTADTLDAPTGLVAVGGTSIILDWVATADNYASGHRVYRSTSSGGPYSQIAEVTPRTTTTYTDDPAAGTYFYVTRAFYQNWESIDSNEASATKN